VAQEHCALNVCLYSPGRSRWTMTERGARHVRRSATEFRIGPSALHWDDGELTILIDEIANPLPRRVHGTVRVRTQALSSFVTSLDDAGRHRWGPIAPCARVQVRLDAPGLDWEGHAYLDSNEGDEPISEPFTTWDWMRAPLRDGSCVVAYDIRQREGRAERLIATRFLPDGSQQPVQLGPRIGLAPTGWRIGRHLRGPAPGDSASAADEPHDGHAIAPQSARVLRTLEDTPFYARSMVQAHLCGEEVVAMHETLDARRFASPLVQALLPWRMPRRG